MTLNTQNILRYFLQHINQHPSQDGNSRIALYKLKKLEKYDSCRSFVFSKRLRQDNRYLLHVYSYTNAVQLECPLFYMVIIDKHFVFHSQQYKDCTFISVLPCEQRPFDPPRWVGKKGVLSSFPIEYLGIN